MVAEPTTAVDPAVVPVTERILSRLGRPRWFWVVLWALVPLLSPLVFGAAVRVVGGTFTSDDFLDFLATQAGLAYACLVLILGVGLLGHRAMAARQELASLAPDGLPPGLFAGIGSVRGPLAGTVIVAVITSLNGLVTYGPLPPLLALPLLVVYLIPILTFVWVDVVILADLDRFGRAPLRLDLFPQDRTLGLGKLGSLASTGLGLLLIASVPVLLAGSDEPVTLSISLAIVALAVAVFILSMWRLHRQMVVAKERYVATAARLYADAYAPIRASTDVETLAAQASVLRAAQALDERAHGLPTWPIDEGAVRFIAVVVTGVVTSLVVRALFAAVGF